MPLGSGNIRNSLRLARQSSAVSFPGSCRGSSSCRSPHGVYSREGSGRTVRPGGAIMSEWAGGDAELFHCGLKRDTTASRELADIFQPLGMPFLKHIAQVNEFRVFLWH